MGEYDDVFDTTIKELREHSEAREEEHCRKEIERDNVDLLRKIFSADQINTWGLIEALINSQATKTNPVGDIDEIRRKLMFPDEE